MLLVGFVAACSGSDDATAGDSGDTNDANDHLDTGHADSANSDTATNGDTHSGSDTGGGTDSATSDGTAHDGAEDAKSTFPVNLGTAGNYAILAKSGISTVPTSAITGDLGLSPAAASYITGFSLTADSTNVFARSPQVTGKIYASDFTAPTPSNLTTAIGDMQLAFTDAAGRPASVTELGAGNIGGKTLTAGVYKWGTGLLVPTGITLTGDATDVWIFQVAKDLTVSDGTTVTMAGGALPKNVFWQVAGSVDLGTTSHFEGNVLGQTSIALHTGASINGRLLAQTAVTLDGSTVVEPAP